MNDKCSAKKAAIPNFFPTIFITNKQTDILKMKIKSK